MTVPGIGPIISSAIVAAIGTGDAFSKGRDFGAWLGLVPKQMSTGDRAILGSISKHGNRYRASQSGRVEARTGLRMMPTFPRLSLSFRTAGFPRYGWKAINVGLNGGFGF